MTSRPICRCEARMPDGPGRWSGRRRRGREEEREEKLPWRSRSISPYICRVPRHARAWEGKANAMPLSIARLQSRTPAVADGSRDGTYSSHGKRIRLLAAAGLARGLARYVGVREAGW